MVSRVRLQRNARPANYWVTMSAAPAGGIGRVMPIMRYTRLEKGAADACLVRARHARARLRAGHLAYRRRQGAGHRGGSRHHRNQVLPAAQRADRHARGPQVRPDAGQAAARAAGEAAADQVAQAAWCLTARRERECKSARPAACAAARADHTCSNPVETRLRVALPSDQETTITFSACCPRSLCVISNSTRWPSSRVRYPSDWIAEEWTKKSLPTSA